MPDPVEDATRDEADINQDYPDPIPGDFVTLYTVANLGVEGDPAATPPVEGETEQRIGFINDDIELAPSFDDEETTLKERDTTVRTPGHHSSDLTFNIRERVGSPDIQALGLAEADTNGNLQFRNKSDSHECVRLYYYDSSPNARAELLMVREIYGVVFRFDDDTTPEGDHTNYDIMGYHNGNEHGTVQWGKTPIGSVTP